MPEILDLPKFNYEDLLQVDRVPLEFIGNASRHIHGHPKTQNLQTADCRPRRPCSISIVFYWSVVQTSVYGRVVNLKSTGNVTSGLKIPYIHIYYVQNASVKS